MTFDSMTNYLASETTFSDIGGFMFGALIVFGSSLVCK